LPFIYAITAETPRPAIDRLNATDFGNWAGTLLRYLFVINESAWPSFFHLQLATIGYQQYQFDTTNATSLADNRRVEGTLIP
jgi:hypothetical protein